MEKNSKICWIDPLKGGKRNVPGAGEIYYAITQPIKWVSGELFSWSFKSIIIETKMNKEGGFESSCITSFLFENAPKISGLINEVVKIFEGPKLVGELEFFIDPSIT